MGWFGGNCEEVRLLAFEGPQVVGPMPLEVVGGFGGGLIAV
jgi:hypothetical protein